MAVRTGNIVQCPACGSDDIVAISMTLEGTGIRFRACHVCEERWWERDGDVVPLETVLRLLPRR